MFLNSQNHALFNYTARGLSGAFLKLCRKVKINDLHFHDLRHEATSRLFEKGLKSSRSSNDYRTQRYQDAHALYAFKSRGFGGEAGLTAAINADIYR